MNHRVALPLLLASIAHCGALVTFQPNQPAKAAEVNQNFAFLDSTLAKKASQSTVDALAGSINSKADGSIKDSVINLRQAIKGLADQATLDKLATERTDTSTFNAFRRQTDAQWKTKQDALGYKPLDIAGGTISGGLKVGGKLVASQASIDSLDIPAGKFRAGAGFGGLYATNKGATPEVPALMWAEDGSSAALAAGKRRIGVSKDGTSPVFNDGKSDQTVWHSGNLDTARVFAQGGPFLKPNAAPADTQTISSNLNMTSISSNFPSHYYSNLWGKDNCFVHFYPQYFAVTKPNIQTFGNLRVWNGLEINTLRLGGDGTLTWQIGSATPVRMVHSGNLDELGVMTANGGTISGNLHVAGNLTSKPNLPIADYVFEPDYKLESLAEVEAFTKTNKHLPEIPSASEMERSGVDVTKMNLLLLKKVEELTLHAIAQQKEIEELKSTVKAMGSR